MELLFDILKLILPAIITGVFTFLATKYTYNKSIPLDKLEITYNRIYYPLYNFIIDYENDIELVVNEADYRFKKYHKYVDRSTLMTFNLLRSADTNAKRKIAYENFQDNICNRSYYLRRRLGYLEPSILQIYKYLSKTDKATFRILIELLSIYILIIFLSITEGSVQHFFEIFCTLIICFLIIDVITKFLLFIYYKFKK